MRGHTYIEVAQSDYFADDIAKISYLYFTKTCFNNIFSIYLFDIYGLLNSTYEYNNKDSDFGNSLSLILTYYNILHLVLRIYISVIC